VAMGRDQLDTQNWSDKAPEVGQVDIDHSYGCHLVETDLKFDPASKTVASFAQTVKMAEGAAKGTMVFAMSLLGGPTGLAIQRTQLAGSLIEETKLVHNEDGTITLSETTHVLDETEGNPTLADLKYGEVGRDFPNRDGYDKDFLGVPLPMPTVGDSIRSEIAPRLDEPGNHVLDYTHFSVIMNGKRRLPLVTAVNIDGTQLVRKKRQNTKWELDNRIAQEHQVGNELYKSNDIDRGHMVRRLDPVWGTKETAAVADYDTFTYDNSNPQHMGLNRKEWVGLEDHILEHARTAEKKLTVFTGSVNRPDDPLYDNNGLVASGIQIPLDYFKIAVMNDGNGGKKAIAFVLSQKDLIDDLIKKETPSGPREMSQEELTQALDPGRFAVYQVPISMVEGLTDLHFGDLQDSDVLKAQASPGSIFLSDSSPNMPIRRLDRLEDMIL
jgi:DNA/RNA endonuclease G (NUC1)